MNISMLLDMAADGFAHRVVIGGGDDGLTAPQLRELALGGARSVRAADADAIVYLAVNGPALPVALFAAAHAGVPLIPVNYRLGAAQLDALLANHPRALGIADPEHGEALHRAGLAARTPDQWLSQAAQATPTPGDEEPAVAPDSPAVLIYTSGTTSTPKGVVLRHHNLVSYVLGTVEFAGAGPDEAALVSVPPYHIAAVSNVLTNLYAGRRALSLDQFTPEGWLDLVRRERVTNAMVVPTMLARIMDTDGLDRSVPSLRALAYGGARMPVRVIETALRAWPHVDFVNAYGLTETSSTITVLGPREHRTAVESDDPAVRARLGSAGLPLPGVELEVRDASGAAGGPGGTGQIWVRGDQVSGEYAGQGSAVDERGFFHTRDQGRVDADGYLYIEGRADDTIIRGAENIAPAEIEDVLLRHPDVLDAVVVGVPDEEWGQRIEAVVVVRAGAEVDAGELRAQVRGTLRGSKTPERITRWPELPRTPTGKLVRRDIVEALTADR
ncbi:class I adenylate-forming enzyme family protein [Streptomyces turgidiscabies]|uniref:AMP-binding enzyme n=1 Tax=Streptomyces turgidiscabies (strain Car8) TaxID=698760 RepID=L7EZQ4_STRT8|nr:MULTISPECIES: class I adenylate-forming enzyme family protein [Streptomyces]ELP64918.1 AMP-binding enzyme [Streptomyces turgidiscabies Car8]MDX3494596.1 class I adenylate-forming enzyme family protein [Streptomyces turgidiscabies]GAQ71203.1 long-chain-fatty-acid--CoA ligase [Streptomyces turgidiscabies]